MITGVRRQPSQWRIPRQYRDRAWALLMSLALLLGVSSISTASAYAEPSGGVAEEVPAGKPFDPISLRSGQELLSGDRLVIGTIIDIKGGQIQVQYPDSLQPRFLPLALAEEKGMQVNKGDRVRMVFNEQQVLVDFHPLDQGEGQLRTLRGSVKEQMKVGQERVVIETDKKKTITYPVRPLIRSKVAAMPVGSPVLFLLDEADQIIDVTFGSEAALDRATREYGRMTKPKSTHARVDGTITKEVTDGRVTVKTAEGKQRTYAVRPYAAKELSHARKGDQVTLLIDDDNQVLDVAKPKPLRN